VARSSPASLLASLPPPAHRARPGAPASPLPSPLPSPPLPPPPQAEWEARRDAQLAALRAQYGNSLLALGAAQRDAALAVEREFEGARAHAPVWRALARAAVARAGAAERAREAAAVDARLAADESVFRGEVMRAAALRERRAARRRGSSAGGRRAAAAAAAAAAASDRYRPSSAAGPDARAQPPPGRPYAGPNAVEVAPALRALHKGAAQAQAQAEALRAAAASPSGGEGAEDEGAGAGARAGGARGQLLRVPQGGPPDRASVVRVPTLLVRAGGDGSDGGGSGSEGEGEGGGGGGSAAAAARRAAEALEAARLESGERESARQRAAARRGSSAARAAREAREGVALLDEMERLEVGSRLSGALSAASSRRGSWAAAAAARARSPASTPARARARSPAPAADRDDSGPHDLGDLGSAIDDDGALSAHAAPSEEELEAAFEEAFAEGGAEGD